VILDLLYPHVAPAAEPPPPAPGMAGNPAGLIIQMAGQPGGVFRLVGADPPAPASRWSARSQPDRTNGVGYAIGTVALVSSEAFRQIGHSMAALLVGMLGGISARGHYRARATGGGSPDPGREGVA
jgi:hypothetical protein